MIEFNEGSTLISQVSATDLADAISAFNATDEAKENGLSFTSYGRPDLLPEDFPVEIENTINVWCQTYIDDDEHLVLANIIKTESCCLTKSEFVPADRMK